MNRYISMIVFSFMLLFNSSFVICMDDLGNDLENISSKIGDDTANGLKSSFSAAQDVSKFSDVASNEIQDSAKNLSDKLKVNPAGESGVFSADQMADIQKAQDDLDGVVNKHKADNVLDDSTAGQESSNMSKLRRARENLKAAEDEKAAAEKALNEKPEDPVAQERVKSANEKITAAQNDIKESLNAVEKESSLGSRIISGAKEMAMDVLKQLPMVIVFTVPSVLQSVIMEENQRKAALRTARAPIQFGSWVVQMPNSCIDQDNAAQSFPLYVTVPVGELGDSLTPDAAKLFPGITWNSNEQYYDVQGTSDLYNKTKLVMSYPAQYYNSIGQSMITDPQFSGLLIDLKDGLAIDAAGEPYTAAYPVPLIPMKLNAPQIAQQDVQAVSQELPGILAKMKTSGLVATSSILGSSSGASVSDVLQAYFDCDQQGKTLVKGGACVIHDALEQYAGGVAKAGMFGAISPLFGWGDTKYAHIINDHTFPHNVQLSFNNSGVIVSDLGQAFSKHQQVQKNVAKKSDTKRVYATSDANYSAEGCWVYLATDTPFVKALGTGSKTLSLQGPYVDYVIFFDEDLNQVSLQIPVEKQVSGLKEEVKWPHISLNPKAKYMASLLSTGLSDFQTKYQGKLIPVMYDITTGEKASVPGLTQRVSAAIQGLQQGFPTLFDQFVAHRNALMSKYHYGPFIYGSDHLSEDTNYEIDVKQGQDVIKIKLYDGASCLGSSVSDLLLPMTSEGGTAVLPDASATRMVSLVTDIEYTVEKDGSLQPSNFDNAPGVYADKKFSPNSRNARDFYWFSKIANNKGANQSDVNKLRMYLEQQRSAWMDGYDSSALVQGMRVNNLTIKLASTLDHKEVAAAGSYVYSVQPNPSATLADQDWFVVVNSLKPSLENLELVNLEQGVSKQSSLVSLVTGNVYDMTGKLRTSRNRPVTVVTTGTSAKETTGQDLFAYMSSTYPVGKGLTEKFLDQYQESVDVYAQDINRPIMVGEFGSLQLGIFAGDLGMQNYVYFNAAGLTSSEKFVPQDLFVTVQTGDKKTKFGGKLTEDTEYVVSLVSGQIYTRSGPSGTMSRKVVWNYANGEGFYWRSTLKGIFDQLKLGYLAQQAAERKELEDLKAEATKQGQKVSLTKSEVQSVIKGLSGPLPEPYASLRQDPVTEQFVHVATARVGGTNQTSYTFFNVPNTYREADGHSIPVGAIYDENGNLIQVLSKAALEALKHQYGVYGASEKTLGIPAGQPSLLLTDDDENITPGKDGKSMIASTSENFPGGKVAMPSGYYLYYSIIMNTYYVLDQVRNRWISVVGGYIYNRQGQPIPATTQDGESLTYVPLNDAGELLTTMPPESYRKARIVRSKGTMTQFVFNKKMYDVKRSDQAGVYALSLPGSKDPYGATLQFAVDENTNVPFVKVTEGSGATAREYKYMFNHQSLDTAQQANMKSIFKGDVAVCPVDMKVGPMVTENVKMGGKDLKVNHPTARTYTLFVQDVDVKSLTLINANNIMSAPAQNSADYAAFSELLFRVSKSKDGRYLATLYPKDNKDFHEPFISYFNRNGFVDLQTGALFDENGKAAGYSLRLEDWLAVLNKLQVTVAKTKDGKQGLFYRRPSTIVQQLKEQTSTAIVS